MILRCSGSEHGGTSQFASRLIGEREVVRAQHSRGTSSRGGFFDQHSHSSTASNVTYQHVTESAGLASKIEQLPDLQGFSKIASRAGVAACGVEARLVTSSPAGCWIGQSRSSW